MSSFAPARPEPGTGGPFLAGPAPATPGRASTTYSPTSVTSKVSGGPGGGGPLEEMLAALIRRKTAPTSNKAKNVLGVNAGSPTMTMSGASRGVGTRPDPLEARKALDAYELTQRGAATRPVGLGPAQTPGMMADPRLLPSSALPEAASFQGPTHSVPQGSISPAQPDAPPQAQPNAASAPAMDPRMMALYEMLRQSGMPAGSRSAANAKNEGVDPIRYLTTGAS